MRAKRVYEFLKTGDVKGSLDIGDVEGRKLMEALGKMKAKMSQLIQYINSEYDLNTKIEEQVNRALSFSEVKLILTDKFKSGKILEISFSYEMEEEVNDSPYYIGYDLKSGFFSRVSIPTTDWKYVEDTEEDFDDAMDSLIFNNMGNDILKNLFFDSILENYLNTNKWKKLNYSQKT